MHPQNTPQGKIVFEFATALVAGEFEKAHGLLVESLKANWPAESLREEYTEMVAYGESPANYVKVMTVLEEWPDKRMGDIGWAYAAIAGEGFSEAVAVVVCDESGKHLVREIEWGRP